MDVDFVERERIPKCHSKFAEAYKRKEFTLGEREREWERIP